MNLKYGFEFYLQMWLEQGGAWILLGVSSLKMISSIMQYMTVYILKCSDSSYYVGVTSDVDQRLWEHNNGIHLKSYTFKRRPVELVFFEHFQNASQAIEFEKQIKGWRRAKKEALINREWEKLPELSKNYRLKKEQEER